MIDQEYEPLQCSLGIEEDKNKKEFHFNIIFFAPDVEKTRKHFPFVIEKFNYYKSKTSFKTDAEANMYGMLLNGAMRIYVSEYNDLRGAVEMLNVAMIRSECPEEFKKEIEEYHNQYQEELEGELEVAEENIITKKEELN